MLRTTRTTPARTRVFRLTAALALPLALVLTGCGDDTDSSGSAETTQSPTEGADSPTESPSSSEESEEEGDGSGANAGTVEITVEDGSFDPTGERVEASVGEELVLEISADAPGELHVHSTPEQEVAFGQGTTSASLPIEQPGVIEVEDHESGAVILQIEAR
jgi:hypothetical protein